MKPTIFEPCLKFKPRLKFFKFDLRIELRCIVKFLKLYIRFLVEILSELFSEVPCILNLLLIIFISSVINFLSRDCCIRNQPLLTGSPIFGWRVTLNCAFSVQVFVFCVVKKDCAEVHEQPD